MNSTKKCLREWNATTEALGQGIQTILIRSYGTNLKGFLLYPSVRYTINKNFLESFQDEHKPFVEANTFPYKEGKSTMIKYYAVVEKVLEKPFSKIKSLANHFIWTNEHVNDYLKNKNGFIWILRVYTLKNPYLAEPVMGMKFVNLNNEVSLSGIEPVLNDSEFNKMIESIK